MITVRDATPADCALLSALRSLAFDEPWPPEAIGRLLALPGAHAAVAEVAGTPCGGILLTPAGDVADLAFIGVAPDQRRRGVARHLLRHSLKAARNTGFTAMLLEVAANNGPARSLYDSEGFLEIGCRKNYYKQGDSKFDAVIMRAELEQFNQQGESISS